MKKLLLLSVMILFAGMMFGQTIQKGTYIGTHVFTVTLNPEVTMDQYIAFFQKKVIPEIEKNYEGWKVYLLKGLRGENANSYGLLFVIKSQKDWDKYYNPDGSENAQGKAVNKKMQPINEELSKLGLSETKYTDWLVQ
ncbi:MAG TPA: hypothetical protein VHO72_14460 [Bacteroidales bacterium]|nr:hypothetical protein [Bacteroidales bacterium]